MTATCYTSVCSLAMLVAKLKAAGCYISCSVQQFCISLYEASSSQYCSGVVLLEVLRNAGSDQLTRLKPSSHSQWYEPGSLTHVWSHPAVPSKHSLMSEHCCPFPLHPTRVFLKQSARQHTTRGSIRAPCCDRSRSGTLGV